MSKRDVIVLAVIVAAGVAYAGWVVQSNKSASPSAAAPSGPDLAAGTPYEAIAKMPNWVGPWEVDAQPSVLETDVVLPLTPEAGVKLAELRTHVKAGGELERHPLCQPKGLPLFMSQKGAMLEFLFAKDHVLVNGENLENMQIFTDGRPVGPDAFDRFHGQPVGHWEDDTLVVESVGFHKWVQIFPGIENGGDLNVTMRIRQTAPDKLENQITLKDAKALSEPYSYTVTYTRHPEREMAEYVCLSKAHADYGLKGYAPTPQELAASSDEKPPVRRENAAAPNAASLPGGTWTSIATLPDWFGPWTYDGRGALGANEVNSHEYVPLTPRYADYRQTVYDIIAKTGDTISDVYHCRPRGSPQMMKAAALIFYVVYSPGRTTIYPDHAQTRRFYTDGRQHPKDLELSFNGHSIAHWEGQMLVADTVGLRPDVQMYYSMPNGGGLRMEEIIREITPGKMEIITTQYSKLALMAPWTYNRTFTKHTDYVVPENYCSEGNRDIDPVTGMQGFDITPPE